ncbi:tetratricopeptide repeat protein [Billgrantia antri]|uniref:tetratricopeptide repeat protein n=1 Tax=Billgrantia antri TaxID=2846777 RepID=UPI003B215BCF
MNPSNIGSLSLVVLLLATGPAVSDEPPEHYQERASAVAIEAMGDTRQLENALAIYNEGLERHPDDPELRSSRANLLASMGRYEQAKRDLDALHENGLHKEGMLLRCMLLERMEGTTDNAMACYAEVEAAYVMTGETGSQPSANHILAARLAGSPEAEALLQEWQVDEEGGQDPIVGEMLKMEREELIRKFLP